MRQIIAISKTIALEIWGLFVDDAAFAVAVVAWLAITGIASHYIGRSDWMPILFFIGLALLLVGGAIRQSKKIRK